VFAGAKTSHDSVPRIVRIKKDNWRGNFRGCKRFHPTDQDPSVGTWNSFSVIAATQDGGGRFARIRTELLPNFSTQFMRTEKV